mmetsp:Transcript_30132/g.64375  ORF Transcript_30132/g.64375 Transcript_30132/m.64375 type:complete len:259 (-) Transcript_30132:2044-2820(-)
MSKATLRVLDLRTNLHLTFFDFNCTGRSSLYLPSTASMRVERLRRRSISFCESTSGSFTCTLSRLLPLAVVTSSFVYSGVSMPPPPLPLPAAPSVASAASSFKEPEGPASPEPSSDDAEAPSAALSPSPSPCPSPAESGWPADDEAGSTPFAFAGGSLLLSAPLLPPSSSSSSSSFSLSRVSSLPVSALPLVLASASSFSSSCFFETFFVPLEVWSFTTSLWYSSMYTFCDMTVFSLTAVMELSSHLNHWLPRRTKEM